jgi:hypothetical protein
VKKLAALIVAASLSACAHAPRTRTVTAEGWAPSGAADARQRAIENAQREAVEKISGVAIAARTVVADGMLQNERLTARARGAVARYEVISERDEDGFHKVKLRAEVDDTMGTPRPEQSVAVDVAGFGGEAAAAGLREALSFHGVSVVADAARADVVVTGEVSAAPIESVTDLAAARATLSFRAVEREGGRVVFQGEPAASAVDPLMRLALTKACARAGEAGATSLSRALVDRAD